MSSCKILLEQSGVEENFMEVRVEWRWKECDVNNITTTVEKKGKINK